MNLADYLRIARKRWAYLVVSLVVCLAAALAYSWVRTPVYSASADVFVSFASAQSTSELTAGASYVQRQVASYSSLVGTDRVLEPVIEELGLSTTPAALRARVAAESPVNTVLIRVTATDADAATAAKVAEGVARNLAEQVALLETPQGASTPSVRLEIVRNAEVPTTPADPDLRMNVLLAIVVGVLVGIGLVALREVTDTRVRSEHDIAGLTSSPVIGRIGFDENAVDTPLVVQSSPYHTRSEAFRRLRTNLQFVDLDGGSQVLVVTSSIPNEGKTTTAVNLAITIADAGSRVLLIDADLRRPMVGTYLGIEESVGLTTALIHRAAWADVIQPWGAAGFFVLPSGPVPPNPAELVGSQAMARLLDEVRARFDYVIIDSPPLLPVTDAALIATMAGGAVVVAACGRVRRDELQHSLSNLEAVSARVLGLVLNRVAADADGYGGSYGYSEYRPRDATGPVRPGVAALAGRLRRPPASEPEERRAAHEPAAARNMLPRHVTPGPQPRWDRVHDAPTAEEPPPPLDRPGEPGHVLQAEESRT